MKKRLYLFIFLLDIYFYYYFGVGSCYGMEGEFSWRWDGTCFS